MIFKSQVKTFLSLFVKKNYLNGWMYSMYVLYIHVKCLVLLVPSEYSCCRLIVANLIELCAGGVGSFGVRMVAGSPRFQCVDCGRLFKQKPHLQRHQKCECYHEPVFACKLCSYKAKKKSTLHSHMLFKHKS